MTETNFDAKFSQPSLYTLNSDYSSPITEKAWAILEAAEYEVLAISMAREMANYGYYHKPKEPGEYLWWILDEAHVKEDIGNDERERDEDDDACILAYQEAAILRRYAIHLMELSIPSIPPTRREENTGDTDRSDQSAF